MLRLCQISLIYIFWLGSYLTTHMLYVYDFVIISIWPPTKFSLNPLLLQTRHFLGCRTILTHGFKQFEAVLILNLMPQTAGKESAQYSRLCQHQLSCCYAPQSHQSIHDYNKIIHLRQTYSVFRVWITNMIEPLINIIPHAEEAVKLVPSLEVSLDPSEFPQHKQLLHPLTYCFDVCDNSFHAFYNIRAIQVNYSLSGF